LGGQWLAYGDSRVSVKRCGFGLTIEQLWYECLWCCASAVVPNATKEVSWQLLFVLVIMLKTPSMHQCGELSHVALGTLLCLDLGSCAGLRHLFKCACAKRKQGRINSSILFPLMSLLTMTEQQRRGGLGYFLRVLDAWRETCGQV